MTRRGGPPHLRPLWRSVPLALLLALLFPWPAFATEAAPIVLQPGGAGKLLHLPLENLPPQLEIRVGTAPSVRPDSDVDVRVLARIGGRYREIRSFLSDDPPDLYVLFVAGPDASPQTITGTIELKHGRRPLAHAPYELHIQRSRWSALVAWLGGGLFAAAAFLLAGMLFNARWLPRPERLALHFRLLDLGHGGRSDTEGNQSLLADLRSALAPKRRWAKWWQAKPLRYALPGHLYQETLQITPMGRNLNPRLVTSEERNRCDKTRNESGHLYAVAIPWGIEVRANPDRRNRIGNLLLEGRAQGPFRVRGSIRMEQREACPYTGRRVGLRITEGH